MQLTDVLSAEMLASTVRALVPVLLVALGGLLCDRAGVFNIALEGFMLGGAFAAVAASYATGSAVLGVLAGLLAGLLASVLLAYGAVDRRGDPIIIGIAVNLLSAGATTFLMWTLFGVRGVFQDAAIAGVPRVAVPGLVEIPWVGPALFDLTVLGYAALLLVVVVRVVLYRTTTGLRLRGVGMRPLSAASLGVTPRRYQWGAILVSGALCGLGGAQLSLGNVVLFAENMTAGRGWIAVVAVILAGGRPLATLGVCTVFALVEAVGFRLQGGGFPVQITDAFPYVVTLLALVLVGARRRVGALRPPAVA